MMAAAALSVVVLSLAPAQASATTATPVWIPLHPSTSPPALYGAAMAYDSATSQVIMFGGMGKKGLSSTTWAWDGTNWSKLSPATSPPARYGGDMAYDSATGQVILFGGIGASGMLDDTWNWDGSNWQKLSPPGNPPALAYAPMTFRGQLIFAGGAGATGAPLSGSWAWNGSTWWKASLSPTTRYGTSIALDQSSGDIYLFGGHSADGLLAETRQWPVVNNSMTWSKLSPTTSPPASYGSSMGYYDGPGTDQVILFGGVSKSGFLGDTWAWDGSDWQKLTPYPAPSARYEAAMTYDSAADELVMFGGTGPNGALDDTWAWKLPKWRPS